VVSYVLAAIFVCAGLVKLWNAQMVAEQFAAWNYPPSFLYLVGCVEVLAGLLLITASARAVGAVLLGILMIGAAATHFLAQQWGAIAVPVVVLAVLVWIAMSSPIRFVSPAEHGTPRTSL
jgi:uncharacterized membrane protein YphA (DoxX/SURF4 family)